ncbi:MAG: ABC transporter permease [Crocinitomicaceae bacterium]
MSKIGLVIGREYSSRVKKKSFVVLTILVPVLFGLLGFAAIWFGMKEQKHFKVLVSDPDDITKAKIFIGQNENPPATFYFTGEELGPEDYEREDLKEYDIFIGIGKNTVTNKIIRGVYREEPSLNTERYITNKLETRLEEYWALDKGMSLEKYREIKQSFRFVLTDIEDQGEADTRAERQAVGFGFSVLIFVFLMVYAGQVMRGVLEEKTSRVVEIIVSSVKPFQLMMGKIIAIGLVGLTQFLIWIILLTIIMIGVQSFFLADIDPAAIQAMGEAQIPGELAGSMPGNDNAAAQLIFEQINWPLLLTLFLIYFIGGYLLYAGLFAIVGAAADSETDTQQLIIPVMIPLMFVYFVSFSILGNPDGPAAIWGSQIPFSSPIIMLQRVAAGTVSVWEVVISLILLAGTFVVTTYLAGKVYRTGILMYGKKASWKEIFKWLRH